MYLPNAPRGGGSKGKGRESEGAGSRSRCVASPFRGPASSGEDVGAISCVYVPCFNDADVKAAGADLRNHGHTVLLVSCAAQEQAE